MSWKRIQAAHEVRMWLKEVIIPAVGIGIIAYSNPDVRKCVGDGFKKAKESIKSKFRKKDKSES
jgi:hypothetical protein